MISRPRAAAALMTVSGSLLLATTYSTPLRAISNTLVIHEFRTRGPNGGFDEFIEIRNISAIAVNLSGWNVVGSNGTGVQAIRATLPDIRLSAGCSWLLGNSKNGYAGPIDQAYAIEITDDGGIGLRAPGGAVADSVRLGSGSTLGEGLGLSPLLTDTDRSYERVGADSDSNAADFVLRSPSTPTASAAGCTGPPLPSTPPSVTASAAPSTLNSGETAVLRATVLPGANPTSTGLAVTVDLSSIGVAASLPLLDDGINGDQLFGDLVFSREVPIPLPTAPGTKTLPITVTDAQGRTVSTTASVTVTIGAPPTPPTAVLNSGPFGRLGTARVSVYTSIGANPTSTGLRVVMDLSPLGGSAATVLSNAGGGLCDATLVDPTFTACLELPPTIQAGPIVLTGTISDAQGRSTVLSFNTSVTPGGDSDSDGLLDAFEGEFGLDANTGAGDNGPSGDPDGDGRTNLEEQAAGTHPRGFFTRYLAEGVTNAFFQTRVALFDIGSPQGANTLIRIQPEGQPERAFSTFVPRLTRRTLTPEDTATFGAAPFSTVVESDRELVVDRTMMWGAGLYGMHTETAVFAPSTTWMLAEGATGWRFSLFYLLQNPSDQAADVQVNYLRGRTDPVLTRTYTVPARQRRTIPVDDEEFPAGSGIKPLGSTDVSARIAVTNGVPIIVERAMSMSPDDQPFGAGHAAAGVPAPSTSWFFAEGATGAFFDEFILLANVGDTPADVTIAFASSRLPVPPRSYVVAPDSRLTVWVDQIPGLEDAEVAATVTSSVPIVAERAMWWPGTGESWREAHASAGATATGPRWAVADLEAYGPNSPNSYILIYNGGRATAYFDDGTPPVACGSSIGGRFTLDVDYCVSGLNKRYVSVIVDGNANTVVERAVYYSPGGVLFGSGGGALGTRIP